MKLHHTFLVFLLLTSLTGYTEDPTPVDPGKPEINPIIETGRWVPPLFDGFDFSVLDASLEKVIGNQTPVKSQGSRGTCSIFSATGMLESLIKIYTGKEIDLAENYLQYSVMSKIKTIASEGSSTQLNVPAMRGYGMIYESTWPYEPSNWLKPDSLSNKEKLVLAERCSLLSGNNRNICLLSHLSPKSDPFSQQAAQVHQRFSLSWLNYRVIKYQSTIQKNLNQGFPVILGLEFFYGAWNHRLMEAYGIGERDMEMWDRGEVGIPTARDIRISRKYPAGHSFVIVGYNDRERIYYFKNSWGQESFGQMSDLLGEHSTPGYGTIPYEYAHRYGSFYEVNYYR